MEMNMDVVIEILTEYLHRERQFDDGPTAHENALVSAIRFLEGIKSQLATREAYDAAMAEKREYEAKHGPMRP